MLWFLMKYLLAFLSKVMLLQLFVKVLVFFFFFGWVWDWGQVRILLPINQLITIIPRWFWQKIYYFKEMLKFSQNFFSFFFKREKNSEKKWRIIWNNILLDYLDILFNYLVWVRLGWVGNHSSPIPPNNTTKPVYLFGWVNKGKRQTCLHIIGGDLHGLFSCSKIIPDTTNRLSTCTTTQKQHQHSLASSFSWKHDSKLELDQPKDLQDKPNQTNRFDPEAISWSPFCTSNFWSQLPLQISLPPMFHNPSLFCHLLSFEMAISGIIGNLGFPATTLFLNFPY